MSLSRPVFPHTLSVLALSVLTLSVLTLSALSAGLSASLAASPASAAPARSVPDGDSLYAISCNFATNEHPLQVMALDGDTGREYPIGESGSPIYFCAQAASWDRVASSCTVYTVARGADEPSMLLRTDLGTGASTLVAPLTIEGASQWIYSFAIDSAGSAWAILDSGELYSVDLATGALTFAADLGVPWLRSLVLDPVDDALYAQDGGTVYRVDPAAGLATPVGPALDAGVDPAPVAGMTIDSTGGFWFSRVAPGNYENPADWVYELLSAAPDRTATEVEGILRTTVAPVGVLTLISMPPQAACGFELPTLAVAEVTPTLAATGSSDPTPIVTLAVAVAVIGGALVAAASLRSRWGSRSRRR